MRLARHADTPTRRSLPPGKASPWTASYFPEEQTNGIVPDLTPTIFKAASMHGIEIFTFAKQGRWLGHTRCESSAHAAE
jgi:hypothetical protein